MPLVTAIPRGLQNGDTITQFTDTTQVSSVTYAYPTTQSNLIIENSGERDIFVTVGSVTDQQIQVDKKWKYDGSFTSFSIHSDVNSQEFTATAIVDVTDDFALIGTQLAQSTSNLNGRGIHVLYPPAPLVACKGDGTTDDTIALQNILNNTTGVINLGDNTKSYKLSGMLSIDQTKTSLLGYGANLLFNIASGVGITVGGATASNYYNTGVIQGVHIRNTNSSNTAIGVLFGGTNLGGHDVTLRNCCIDGFQTNVSFSHNAYLINFEKCAFINALYNVDYPSGLTNSGENIHFDRCVIANATNGVRAKGGEMFFDMCSFDYLTRRFLDSQLGSIFVLNKCHIEGNSDADYWISTTNAQSLITLEKCSLTLAANKTAYPFGNVDSAGMDGGIHLDGLTVIKTQPSYNYGFQYLIYVNGRAGVTSKNLLPFNTGGWFQSSNVLNRLLDGGFENGNLSEWVVATATSTNDVPVVSNLNAHSGTNSLMLKAASGKYIAPMSITIPVVPGQKPRLGYWALCTLNSSTTYWKVTAQYLDKNNGVISAMTYSHAFSGNASEKNPTSWTQYFINPTTPVPYGATQCQFLIQQGSASSLSDGLGSLFLDDMLITVE